MRASLHIFAALTLTAGAAAASREYPSLVATHLSLNYAPGCSLCHVGAKTGSGTAQTPFAQSMQAHGLQGGAPASVAPALDALLADRVDSDGDGATDIQELLAGTDPNVAGAGANILQADPAYGCATGSSASLLAIAVALLFARRAAARRRRLGIARRIG